VNIIWRRQAEADLSAAADYIAERNPEAAEQLEDRIIAAVDRLAEFSGLGRAGRVPSTRELVVSGTAYIVAYTVDTVANSVVVLRVLSGRQQWPESFEAE
jgi:toxin ParE1/3/4